MNAWSARQPDVEIAARASGYGLPGIRADGNDVPSVYRETEKAVKRARAGGGPTLLEFRTYRWKGHVGLVHRLTDGMLYTIEGNKSPKVQGFSYVFSRMDKLLGFGHVP